MNYLLDNILRDRAATAEPWPASIPSPSNLRKLRQALGLTQRRLAELGGISRLSLVRYENEKNGDAVFTSLNRSSFRRLLTAMYEEAARIRTIEHNEVER